MWRHQSLFGVLHRVLCVVLTSSLAWQQQRAVEIFIWCPALRT